MKNSTKSLCPPTDAKDNIYPRKERNENKIDNLAEASHLKDEFTSALEKLNVSTWYEFFKMTKEMTNVKIYICSLAGKIWGGEKLEDFNDLTDDILALLNQ